MTKKYSNEYCFLSIFYFFDTRTGGFSLKTRTTGLFYVG